MKKLSLLLVLPLLVLAANAQKTVNDPNAVVRNHSGFHAIKVSNAFDVYISQGNTEAVAVSASSAEYRDRIRTSVENGVLVIRFDNDKKFWKQIGGDKTKLKAYISVKKLDKLDVSGACDVFFEEGISAESLILEVSGASDVKGKINAKTLGVELNGASDITLTGNVQDLKVQASGASDFKGFDLVTNNCDVKVSGASSVHINVSKELNVVASGASDVKYKGSGMIREIRSSGASSVTRKS